MDGWIIEIGTIVEIDDRLRVVVRTEGKNIYLMSLKGDEKRYELSQVLAALNLTHSPPIEEE